MSYILEALKKADAERERGSVPGLHTQTEPLPADEQPPFRATPVAIWIVAGVSLSAALVMGYALWGRNAPIEAGAEALPEQSMPTLHAKSDPAQTEPSAQMGQTESGQVSGNAPMANEPTALAKHRAEPKSRKDKVSSASSGQNGSSNESTTSSKSADAGTVAMPKPTARPSPAHTPLSLSELPENIRRELPQLSIGGAMHSDAPSSRILILSNGVFHEGDQPAPGLILEEIKLKSAVFNYKGYRYSVNY